MCIFFLQFYLNFNWHISAHDTFFERELNLFAILIIACCRDSLNICSNFIFLQFITVNFVFFVVLHVYVLFFTTVCFILFRALKWWDQFYVKWIYITFYFLTTNNFISLFLFLIWQNKNTQNFFHFNLNFYLFICIFFYIFLRSFQDDSLNRTGCSNALH
jgi:hypothetical protein